MLAAAIKRTTKHDGSILERGGPWMEAEAHWAQQVVRVHVCSNVAGLAVAMPVSTHA